MNILLLQLKRIGDLVLTTPAIVALREAFPEAKITLAIMDGCSGLAGVMPAVDQVEILRRKGRNAALWLKLAMRSSDLCLDFSGTDRSAFLSLLSKADRRITFQWVQRSRLRALFYNEFVDSSVRERHTVDHYLDLLRPLGLTAPQAPITLALNELHHGHAERIVREAGVEGPYIILHPGTARVEKYWLPERWAEVADWCRGELGLPCLLTGGNDRYERDHLDALLARSRRREGGPPLVDLAGRLDLATVAALISRAHLLLSVDSAPVHIGAAFQTRQIALYGPTNPYHWRARHEKAITLHGAETPPFSPRAPRRMMSDLSTQHVIDAIGTLCP